MGEPLGAAIGAGHVAEAAVAAGQFHVYTMRQASEGSSKWWKDWLSTPGNAELLQTVLERLRADGPLRGADFEHDGPKRNGWWDWKPAKRAMTGRKRVPAPTAG